MKLKYSIDSDRGEMPMNLYPSEDKEAGVFLRGTPGLVQWVDTGDAGPIRGMCAKDSILYVVSGQGLYQITLEGTCTQIGTLSGTTGRVWITDNSFHLIVVDPPAMYLHEYASGTTSPIGDPDFPGASCADFLDGYIVFAKPSSQQIYITAGYDATSIDALDFFSAEANPDGVVTLLVDHRELMLFGTETVEFWYNAGNSDFPLARVQGSTMEIGCGAAGTPATVDNSVMWLDNRGMVVRAAGYKPEIVSTRKLEREIASLSRTDDAYAFSYTHAGHSFYQLTFPTGDRTYCYDAATGTWHRRAYTEDLHACLASAYAHFGGRHFVGSREGGIVYELSSTAYDDAGHTITRQWECDLLDGEGRYVSIPSLYVDMTVGVGLESGQGEDPQLSMIYSNDDGKTWSSEQWASFGKIGDFSEKPIFYRLGAARKRRFRFSITDPNPVNVWGVHAQIRGRQS